MKTNEADLSRPEVEVKIETVKIGMADLAYLRALTQPKKLRCAPSSKTLDKLRFLDLIARAKIAPTPEEMREWKTQFDEVVRKLDAARSKSDWTIVNNLSWELKTKRKPESVEDDVLTERGKRLLAQGNATVRVRKVGCVE